VTSFTFSPENPVDGQEVSIDATVQNIGACDTMRDFYVALYVDDSYSTNTSVSGGLEANATTDVTLTWTATPGEHTLTIKADYSSSSYYKQVSESNEENNELSKQIVACASPDLTVTSFTFSPGNPVDGQKVSIDATVQNIGACDTMRDFYVALYVDDSYKTQTSVSGGLNADASTDVTLTWTATPGEHTLTVKVDDSDWYSGKNLVSESNEENNELSKQIVVCASPDLTVTSFTFSPENPVDGQEVSITATVQNIGACDTMRGFYVTLYVDDDSYSTDTSYVSGGLNADASIDVTLTWYATPGEHTLTVKVDYNGKVSESNEENNELSRLIPPKALTLTLIEYSPDPTNDNTPTLDWNDVANTSTYHIQIDDDADFGSPIVDDDTLTDSTYIVTSPLPEGGIYWRVKSKDQTGNESSFSGADSFTIDITPPMVPTLVLYAQAPTNNTKPTLDWNDVEDASTYHIQMDDDSDFSSTIVDDGTLTNNVYILTIPLPEKLIYWRVKSKDVVGNESEYSQADSFLIDMTPPAVPTLIEYTPDPTNDNTPTLYWNDVGDASTYHIQIDNDENFSSLIIEESSLTSSVYTSTSTLPEGVIYWRVKSKDAAGNESGYSVTDNFTIDTTVPDAGLNPNGSVGQARISVSPNSIDFGIVRVNEIAQEKLTIRNIGSSELKITNITTDAEYITISEVQFTIQPSEDYSVTISFRPSSVYKFGGNLTIESNAPSSPTTVALSGKFPKPEITKLEPISGRAEGGTEIIITGSNFIDDSTVEIGGEVVEAQVHSSTQIAAKTPAGSAGEKVDILVTNPDSQQARLEDSFMYKKEPHLMLMVSPESVVYRCSDMKVDIELDMDGASSELVRQQEIIITYKKPIGLKTTQKASPMEGGSNTHTTTLNTDEIDEVGVWTVTAHWKGNDEYLSVNSKSKNFEVTKIPSMFSDGWVFQTKQKTIDNQKEPIDIHSEKVPIDTTGLLKGALVPKVECETVTLPNIKGKIVTLEFTAPDRIVKEFTIATEDDGVFKEYAFDSEGDWTIKASWNGNDTYQGCESIIVVHVVIEAPKAIVVLGGDKDSRDFDDFNTIANKVYRILTKGRGFRDEVDMDKRDVYYLNPQKNQDDKTIHVDALTSEGELEYAITVWAAKYVSPHTPLLIYLLSHNTVDHFLLESPRNAKPHFTPNELDNWISELEKKLLAEKQLSPEKPVSITIFIDACSSGNFLKPLAKEVKKEGETVIRRTVITSTSLDEPAHIRPADSFSLNFFNRVNVDYDVRSAFVDAKDIITAFRGQNPLLDSNGDGIPNEQLDYEKVEGVKIGSPMGPNPPTIEKVLFLPSQLKQGESAVISVNVLAAKIESVTGVLIPPSYDRKRKVEHWSELDSGLINFEFQQSDDVRIYASKPYKFTECGKYILIVHAGNPDGDAVPYKTQITIEECNKAVQSFDKQITQWGAVKITMLHQNYPNPFNADTWIPFQLAGKSDVMLTIHNLQGKTVRHIKLGIMPTGAYLSKDKAIYWDGHTQVGETVASGIYFYRLQAGDYIAVKRMVILK